MTSLHFIVLTVNTDFNPLADTWWDWVLSDTQICSHVQSGNSRDFQWVSIPIINYEHKNQINLFKWEWKCFQFTRQWLIDVNFLIVIALPFDCWLRRPMSTTFQSHVGTFSHNHVGWTKTVVDVWWNCQKGNWKVIEKLDLHFFIIRASLGDIKNSLSSIFNAPKV